MAANDATTIWLSQVNIFHGAVDTTAATALGFIKQGGVQMARDISEVVVRAHGRQLPLHVQPTEEDVILSMVLEQWEPETMALALGRTESGQRVNVGGASGQAGRQRSFKLTGTRKDGTLLTMRLWRAEVSGSWSTAMSLAEGENQLPIQFRLLESLTKDQAMEIDVASGTIVSTLATGVLTRTAGEGYHKVAGEGAAPDALTSITGAGLVDAETLRLQINDVNDPITLTHLALTLELEGAVDWIMDDVNDYIDLRYNLSGTKWVEYSRFDAP